MPQPVDGGERPEPTTPSQSGVQVWLACALFVLVPVSIVLLVKYLMGV